MRRCKQARQMGRNNTMQCVLAAKNLGKVIVRHELTAYTKKLGACDDEN